MPLRALVQQQQERIRQFLNDSQKHALWLRVEPEMEMFAGRVIAGLEDDPNTDVMAFAVMAPFTDANTFFTSAAKDLIDQLQKQKATFAEEGIVFELPEGIDGIYRRATPASRFAELIELLASALSPLCEFLVIVVRPESVSDPALYRKAVADMLQCTGAPAVKYILFDGLANPSLAGLSVLTDRRFTLAFERNRTDFRKAIAEWVNSDSTRVLSLHVRDIRAKSAAEQIEELLRAELKPPFKLFIARQHYGAATSFFDEATQALTAEWPEALESLGWLATAFAGLEKRPPDEDAPLQLSELQLPATWFCRAAEAAARRLLPERGHLVCVIAPDSSDDSEDFAAAMNVLADEAASPRVKYIIAERADQPVLPIWRVSGVSVPTVDFQFSPDQIEEQAAKRLADGTFESPLEQLRFTSLLSGFALARGDFTRAAQLGEQAIKQSKQMGDPAEQALAWLSMGHLLYRMQSYGPACNAYSEAATIALDTNQDVMTAQSLVGLANTHYCEQDFGEAVSCYSRALEFQQKLGSKPGAARVLIWLGESYRGLGDHEKAEQSFRLALMAHEGQEVSEAARQGKAEVLTRMARLYTEQKRQAESRELARQAGELGGCELQDLP